MKPISVFPILSIVAISTIGCKLFDNHGEIKPSEVNTISSTEVLVRSEKAANYLEKQFGKSLNVDQLADLKKFAKEQSDIYSSLSKLRHNDSEIMLACANLYKAVMIRVVMLDPNQASSVNAVYNKILSRAILNTPVESTVFIKIYNKATIDTTTRAKARQFAIYSLNNAKLPSEILHWMDESFKHTNSEPLAREQEMAPLNIVFKQIAENNKADTILLQKINDRIKTVQDVVDDVKLSAAQFASEEETAGTEPPTRGTLTPNHELLQKELDSLKHDIGDFIAMNAQPLDMTFGTRANGTKGQITVEECFETNAKRIIAIEKELKTGDDISRYKLDYEDYKKQISLQKNTNNNEAERILILTGIGNEVGMSVDNMIKFANTNKAFKACLNSAFVNRRAILQTMKAAHTRMPFNDFETIRDMRRIAHNQ